MARIIILMGVSGAGKSTVGRLLAERLGWPFYEGDDYHPQENIDKMRRAEALTDKDRQQWLNDLQKLIRDLLSRSQSAVLACSSLKDSYRQQLADGQAVEFIYLAADPELTRQRLRTRKDHFVTDELLASQLATLEEPEGVLTLENTLSPSTIVAKIRQSLQLPGN